MSSNCAKEWSGTQEDFEKRKKKIEYQIRFLLRKHRECDKQQLDEYIRKKERKAINRLRSKVKKINRWLRKNEDRELGKLLRMFFRRDCVLDAEDGFSGNRKKTA